MNRNLLIKTVFRVSVITLVVSFIAMSTIRPTYGGSTFTNSSLTRGQADDGIADIVLGKPNFNEVSSYSIVSTRLALPHGVFINRNNPSDNKMYVDDAGNNRILGFDLEDCRASLTEPLNCIPTIVLGQPNFNSGACNGDSGFQNYPTPPIPSASTLCLEDAAQLSISEGGSGASMAVDSSNNLYIADFFNNRVLKYNNPFATDNIADEVWGQDDFTGYHCNKGFPNPSATSLCFSWGNSNNWTASVDIDSAGNLWVGDSANNRVLKFPNVSGTISKTATLVLGQSDFVTATSGTALNKFHDPSSVRVNS